MKRNKQASRQIRISGYVKNESNPMHANSICSFCGVHGANRKKIVYEQIIRSCWRDECKRSYMDSNKLLIKMSGGRVGNE